MPWGREAGAGWPRLPFWLPVAAGVLPSPLRHPCACWPSSPSSVCSSIFTLAKERDLDLDFHTGAPAGMALAGSWEEAAGK